jgi:ATP phosphoribosyltransferase
MRPPRIGLPKGQLHRRVAVPVLQRFGIEASLTVDRVKTDGLELLFVKPRDVTSLLRRDVIDVGVAPDEWILEDQCARSSNTLSVCGFASVAVVDLAWLYRSERGLQSALRQSEFVVSSFPAIARAALHGVDSARPVFAVSGSVEAIVASRDVVGLDVVESGDTAHTHGLVVESVTRTRGMGVVTRADGGAWDWVARDLVDILGVEHGN